VIQAMAGEVPAFDLPGRAIRPGLRVGPNVRANFNRVSTCGPVYIAGSAEVGKDCKLIGPVVVGAGAVIEPGVTVESSIVLDHTRVGSGAEVRNKVLGPRFCFAADGTVLDARHTDTAWLFSDARSVLPPLTVEQRRIVSGLLDAIAA